MAAASAGAVPAGVPFLSLDPDAEGLLRKHAGISTFLFPTGQTLGEYLRSREYEKAQKFPSGYSGSAYKIVVGPKEYVLKHITNPKAFKNIPREIEMLTIVKGYPFAVQLLAAQFNPDGSAYMLFPYIPGQSLFDYINDLLDKKSTLTEEEKLEAKEVIKKVIYVLKALHDLGIIHRDIKPGNIWIPANKMKDPILLDFGLSGTTSEVLGFGGTMNYVRPGRNKFKRNPTPNDNYYAVKKIIEHIPHVFSTDEEYFDVIWSLGQEGITNEEAEEVIKMFGGRRTRHRRRKHRTKTLRRR